MPWEGNKRQKNSVTIDSFFTYLLSQNETCTFTAVLCFLQVVRSSNYYAHIIGKKGSIDFSYDISFLAVFLLGQDMVVSQNEPEYRIGPPFLQ